MPAKAASRDFAGLVARSNVLLPGSYAWLTTVAFPAAGAGVGLLPRVTAGVALVALLVGATLRFTEPRLARIVGLLSFVGLCILTWVLLGPAISVERLEPIRAALGAVAWGLFAFGWGDVRKPGEVPEHNPRADIRELLRARRELPPGAYAVFALSLLLGLSPVFLAWQVVRPEHALLAHCAAAACAIAMVSAGARVAVGRGVWRPLGAPVRRLNRAAVPLTLVALLGLLGILRLLLG